MGHVSMLLSFCAFAIFVSALLLAAVTDAKTHQIPNIAHLLLLTAGVLNLLACGLSLHSIVSALFGLFLGGFPLLILAILRGTVGGGDVKLAASGGFALGWLGSYLALMAALIGFVLFALIHRPKKKGRGTDRTQPLPFAPFYAAGIGMYLLFAVIRYSFSL